MRIKNFSRFCRLTILMPESEAKGAEMQVELRPSGRSAVPL